MNLKELINTYQVTVNDNRESGTVRSVYGSVLEDLKQLDELTTVSTKVEIPQCAIDVIENAKEQGVSLFEVTNIIDNTMEFCNWIDLPANQELFARAWLEGYEEIRYFVKVKNVRNGNDVLRYDESGNYWDFGSVNEYASFRTKHTRKELEKADFGEVFDNPLFEVEEIKTKS